MANGGTQYTRDARHARHARRRRMRRKRRSITLTDARRSSRRFRRTSSAAPTAGAGATRCALPDARVASAELFVTNQRGNSPASEHLPDAFGGSADCGRYRGGQYSISGGRVPGGGTIGRAAVGGGGSSTRCGMSYAVLGTAADAAVQLQVNVNGAAYCQCTFQPGMTISQQLSAGLTLPPLAAAGANDALGAGGGTDVSGGGPDGG